jgi:ribonuclease BN (tRNA processing enzyme)
MHGIRNAGDAPIPQTGLHVVFLGTKGGPPPTPEATGISSAVIVDGRVYLVDVGRAAVTQYVRAGLALGALRGVFITHLHADHIGDYFNLFLLAGNGHPKHRDSIPDRVDVFGPGPAGGLPGGDEWPTQNPDRPTPGIRALTDLAADAYAYSTNLFVRESGIRRTRDLAAVREIDVSATGASFENTSPAMDPLPVWEDGDVRVTATLVPHGPVFPAFAYRFDTPYGSVTFSGDTTYSDNLERLAAGTDLLVHEAINIEGAQMPEALREHLMEGHVEVQKVGAIAQRAGAKRLVLSHTGDFIHRVATPDRWEPWAQEGFDGSVHLARDLELLTIAD